MIYIIWNCMWSLHTYTCIHILHLREWFKWAYATSRLDQWLGVLDTHTHTQREKSICWGSIFSVTSLTKPVSLPLSFSASTSTVVSHLAWWQHLRIIKIMILNKYIICILMECRFSLQKAVTRHTQDCDTDTATWVVHVNYDLRTSYSTVTLIEAVITPQTFCCAEGL